jgi:RimJ/RimL family protein N-acetyltransferase
MPVIKILQPGDEPALEAFLQPQLDSSMFLIGNLRAAGLAAHGQPHEGTYAAAFEEGHITGVVALYWNESLILQAPVHLDALWPVAVKAAQRPIHRIIGPADQAQRVKEALAIKAALIQRDETERLYSLNLADLIEPSQLRSGQVQGRQIEPRDLDLITQWRVDYSVEALNERDGLELHWQCRASVERSLKEGRTWLLEDQGRPVACTSFNTAIAEAVQVGGVWTPPELRGRSYARCVVAASLLEARAEGVEKAILFTGEDNLPAQKAYEALGFRRIGDYGLILLNTPGVWL